jgi:hypothetical protein
MYPQQGGNRRANNGHPQTLDQIVEIIITALSVGAAPRQPTPLQARIIKTFSNTSLNQRPHLTTWSHFISTLSFTVLLLAAVSADRTSPLWALVIIGYWGDLIMEIIISALYNYVDAFLPLKYSRWCLVPTFCKLLSCLFISIDYYHSSHLSGYFCFLPLIPPLFKFLPSICYHKLSLPSALTSLFYSIAEVLLLVKIFLNGKYTLESIFIYLFYYLIVTFFFTGLLLFVAIIGLLCRLCRPNQTVSPKIYVLQAFIGIDTIFETIGAKLFANYMAAYESLQGLPPPSSPGYVSDINLLKVRGDTAHRALLLFLISSLVYLIIRLPLGYYLSLGLQSLFPQGRQPQWEVRVRDRGNASNQPTVVTPPTQTILNLFRINSNYYGNSEAQRNQPQAQSPAATTTVQASPEKREEDDLCSICMEGKQNCIILDCRHGGICKSCSIDMLKKSDLCPFCRKTINKICVVTKISEQQYKITEEIKL